MLTSIAQSEELLSRNGSDATRSFLVSVRRQLLANAAISFLTGTSAPTSPVDRNPSGGSATGLSATGAWRILTSLGGAAAGDENNMYA
jgi:hypothetical protein